ncbi:flagellar biosynthetic protein FliO [Faecalicatena sp. AGMB00832]|uniref:Flagellar biosynthetic protein FliO n=1 Tax=Faecalicatena faecalis TaxID=2726362 RepID=A0ABS6DBI9_9FIRM|nr:MULTISPECIES: flagellar biosynthetic protein FliO [Faecalicatena]MBU3878562.1 flagellar biosynthetic protein FliO [Faecalicatena faecalis]MCI6466640.1 flagellar biosynthetic protein FliO [Faecalicatena sp.]MDY5620614.1 flagellar biosynthetic protein FliO [Lachnospiraceae bacterium]
MIVLKLLLYFAVLIGVLVLAYYTTKLIAGTAGPRQSSANIQVLEKVTLGKESYLLIARVQERIVLLGVTPGGIQKLEELDEYIESSQKAPEDFGRVLAKQIQKNFGSKSGRNKNRGDRE